MCSSPVGMTAGFETTIESVVSRHTHEQTGNNTGMSRPQTEAARLPDYREPPKGFFEGDPGFTAPAPVQRGSDAMQGKIAGRRFQLQTFLVYE